MISVFVQSDTLGFNTEAPVSEIPGLLAHPDVTIWIDLHSPSDSEVLTLQEIFNFHPLCIEDCLTYSNSPKLDEFESYLFLVTHEPHLEEGQFSADRPELDFFLGSNYLVSFHFHDSAAIHAIQERCRAQAHLLDSSRNLPHVNMFRNSDFVLQGILDALVDSYFPVLEMWEDKMTQLEDRMLGTAESRPSIHEIMHVKRELSAVRRLISPQRDVIARLVHSEHPALSQHSRFYFQDVYDHVIRAFEIMDGHRDAMHNVLEAYYSLQSSQMNESTNRMNFIMQRLTIITTIFMPLSFLAGIYGMNFPNMPEMGWAWAYYAVLAIMGGTAIGMLVFFRRQKWL